MKKILIFSMVWMAALACVPISGLNAPKNVEEPKTDEQLKAEYHLMKNNLSLATRENEVLKGENRMCKTEIGQLKEEIGGLKTDLAALNKKYEQDMALMNEKYGALQTQFKTLEEQSNAKIQELTDLGTAAQTKLTEETQRFDQTLKAQQEAAATEKRSLEAAFAQKTQEYDSRLNNLTKDLKEKEGALAARNADLNQAKAQMDNLQKSLAENQTKAAALQKVIDDHQTASQSMQKALDEKQAALLSLQKTLDERQATIAAMEKTIDEQKTTIGTLQKTIDAGKAVMEAAGKESGPVTEAPEQAPKP